MVPVARALWLASFPEVRQAKSRLSRLNPANVVAMTLLPCAICGFLGNALTGSQPQSHPNLHHRTGLFRVALHSGHDRYRSSTPLQGLSLALHFYITHKAPLALVGEKIWTAAHSQRGVRGLFRECAIKTYRHLRGLVFSKACSSCQRLGQFV